MRNAQLAEVCRRLPRTLAALVLIYGLLLLLNFTDGEVRDRDYFYFGFYQFAALFLGLGVVVLLVLAGVIPPPLAFLLGGAGS